MLRCLGADVLGQLGFEEQCPFADEATPVLVALLDDAEATVVSSALVALGHLGTGDCAGICALAGHESEEVRHSVAYCLGTRDEPVARQTLTLLSRDSDPDVRDWATFGLGTLSDFGQRRDTPRFGCAPERLGPGRSWRGDARLTASA
ncbi:MAG: hypothetical protein DMF89_22535 [Acidobacteria bacterium]|nr:MAG: hypothetical protein DMF89_22535 [Acidobacteriota bacterium]